MVNPRMVEELYKEKDKKKSLSKRSNQKPSNYYPDWESIKDACFYSYEKAKNTYNFISESVYWLMDQYYEWRFTITC